MPCFAQLSFDEVRHGVVGPQILPDSVARSQQVEVQRRPSAELLQGFSGRRLVLCFRLGFSGCASGPAAASGGRGSEPVSSRPLIVALVAPSRSIGLTHR